MKYFRVVVNGNEYKVAIEELEEKTSGISSQKVPRKQAIATAPQSKAREVTAKEPLNQTKTETNGDGAGKVVAAMPGTILEVKVSIGDTVKRGQALLILEAMKMENEIMAASDGVISEIFVTKGASVNSGDLLMVMA